MKNIIILIIVITLLGVGSLSWLYFNQPEYVKEQQVKTKEVVEPVIEPGAETSFAESVFYSSFYW